MGSTAVTAANGVVGDTVGTKLTLANDVTGTGLATMTQASADTDSFDIRLRKARGTTAAPTAITTGDELGTIQFWGYDGAAGYIQSGAIKCISSGTIADSRVPSTLEFYTSTNAAPSVLTKVCQFSNAGVMSIYSTLICSGSAGTFQGPSNGGFTFQPDGGTSWSGPSGFILDCSAGNTRTSGTVAVFQVNTVYNQSGTTANTDILVNRTETALGSGAQLLIDLQVASAPKFNVSNTGKALSYGPTAGIGYGTGAGGTVTQATSKATAFTLSTVSGEITMAGDALNAGTIVSSTWTNTAIAATDVVVISHKSGGTVGAYTFNVACGAGTATLTVRNNTAGNLTETPVLQFVVIKGVSA